MGMNAISNEQYGFLTRECMPSKDRLLLGLPARLIHGTRNLVNNVLGVDAVQNVLNTVV